jgi:hypothetical protein
MTDIIRQLEQRLAVPVAGNALEVKRREFSLEPVFEGEVELRRLAGLAMAEERLGFARIMITVVVEENNFTADLRLQPAGRLDFGDEEAFREKPARLLAETNDRRGGHDLDVAGVDVLSKSITTGLDFRD